jgi:hypothetical protein
MVIVTDGGDTTSAKDFHAALNAAQLANTVIYPVLVMPITNDAGRNIGGENALTTMAAGHRGPGVHALPSARLWIGPSRISSKICGPSICWATIRKTCRSPRSASIVCWCACGGRICG